ncbi:MAG: glycine betaine/L-proline ABC transporter substrate-binding protein ProX [Thermodesulfobacteriota bacterium]
MFRFILSRSLLIAAALAVCFISGCGKSREGKKEIIQPARATWNTGYFQEALVRRGLIELGYEVKKPKDLQNSIFYQSVTLGDVDYWANGWFPLHNNQLPKNFYESADTYGYVLKEATLQGYLVSKPEVEKYGIKSLDDFRRPEVKEAFDSNDDGKADLVSCTPGWGCANTINHHLDVYGLRGHINPTDATYAAGMAQAIANYKNNKPVFFFTWAPNWTIAKLKPGKDVMWINVPEIIPSDNQKGFEDRMVISGVKGAVTDPVRFGFVVSDIRIAANRKFVEGHPDIKKFFLLFSLPLSDINAQNAKMNEGEDSETDIQRHVDEWIKKNQQKWNGWLEEASALQ